MQIAIEWQTTNLEYLKMRIYIMKSWCTIISICTLTIQCSNTYVLETVAMSLQCLACVDIFQNLYNPRRPCWHYVVNDLSNCNSSYMHTSTFYKAIRVLWLTPSCHICASIMWVMAYANICVGFLCSVKSMVQSHYVFDIRCVFVCICM